MENGAQVHRDGLQIWNWWIRALWYIWHYKWCSYVFLWIYRLRLRGHNGRGGQVSATIHSYSNRRVPDDSLPGVLWRIGGAHHRDTVLRAESRSTVSSFIPNDRMGLGQVARIDRSDLRTVFQVIYFPFITCQIKKWMRKTDLSYIDRASIPIQIFFAVNATSR